MQSNLHYWCCDFSPNDSLAIQNLTNKYGNDAIQILSLILEYQIAATKNT